MGWVLIHYSLEAMPLSVIIYAVTWRIVGGPKVHSERPVRTWHIIGATTVALGTGITRLVTAYVLGGHTMQELWTLQGIGLIGPGGVPVVLSIGAVLFVRLRGRSR
ncbi:MAG: hypothetical protein JW395_0050 [Nitrospira sp.]|nr:hypothetical protein [Nitrospira sp.]